MPPGSTFLGTWVVVGSTTTLSAGQGCTADSTTQLSCTAPWVVRDVVTHLLGDDLGRLARIIR